MKTINIIFIVSIAIGTFGCGGLHSHVKTISDNDDAPLGLSLVAKYDPLQLKIYADLSVTNSQPIILIANGNKNIFYRCKTDADAFEETLFENGYQIMTTKVSTNGSSLRRMLFFRDKMGTPVCSYIDSNGAGGWDFMIDEIKHVNYVRTNLCWVPISLK